MSLSTTIDRVTYAGDNTTTSFSFGYKFYNDSDLIVIIKTNSTGAETVKTLTTHYTISGTKTDGIYLSGANIVFGTAPLSSQTVIIYRDIPVTQEFELTENGKIPADNLEKQLDKITAFVQRTKNKLNRSVSLPEGYTGSFDTQLPPIPEANKAIVFNSAGNGFSVGPSISQISNAQSYATAAETAKDLAQAAQVAAELAKTNAETAETNAELAETNALASKVDAEAAKLAAELAEANAATSAANALISENNAATSESNAATSESNALTSETNAATSEANAALSETNAATSESNAAISESNAATSAANAAISETNAASYAAASAWSDVVYKTFANSPITIQQSDAGKLYSIDCSGGNVVVNLPAISGLNLTGPWSVGVQKTDSGTNTISIIPNGTDTIGLSASYIIGKLNQGVVAIPDIDKTPDDWASLPFGSSIELYNYIDASGGLAFTTTSGGTLTLTPTSTQNNAFTGTNSHILVLPDPATMVIGKSYETTNRSTGDITVKDHAGTTLYTLKPNQRGQNRVRNSASAPYWGSSIHALFDSNNTYLDAASKKISNVTDPASAQDAATKNWVETNPYAVVNLDGQASTPSNPSAGNYKAYVKDTTGKLTILNSSGVETTVGSGAGSKNYITNGDAESATTGWATYADAAGTRPVDGTGGSPTVTWTASSTNPLEGLSSFIFTKDAANRQGEGASYAFSIDSADQARVLQISFDYLVGSGTFVAGTSSADSDVIVYLYDVTNAVLIEPSSIKLLSNSSTLSSRFSGTFQTAYNSTSYRLILHCATTSASAYTLKIDNVKVSPSTYAYGTPVTDWVSWTPTGSWSTNTTYTGYKRRVGDTYEYDIKVATSGAPTTATLTVNILETIDTSKITNTTNFNMQLGTASIVDGGTQYYEGAVRYASATSVGVFLYKSDSTYAVAASVDQATPFTFGASDFVGLKFSVPIVGLSSSVQMSDQTDTRVVAAAAYGDAASASANNPFIFPTVNFDTHGAYSASTGRYTCPAAGKFEILLTAATTGGTAGTLYFYKNAVQQYAIAAIPGSGAPVNGSVIVDCNSGDIIDLRPNTTTDMTAGSITFKRISGPSAIAANESINCRYTNTAGTSIANSGDVVLGFATKDYDSHGAYVTDTFTVPSPGKYRLSGTVVFQSATYAIGNRIYLAAYKNGSLHSIGHYNTIQTTTAIVAGVAGTFTINCVAGDTIVLRVSNNRTAGATSLDTTSGVNSLTIEKVS